jgi:hypothetical protein
MTPRGERRTGRIFAFLVFALSALAGATACGSAKRESASLVAAVDRYRRAEMAAKGAPADAIEAAPCTVTEVCDAKAACVASARPTVKGALLKAEVESSLAELHAGKITQEEAASRKLPEKLDLAGQLLDEGHAKLPACDVKITALRREYGL